MALLGADPNRVAAHYQAIEQAIERGGRIDTFMEKLAERRRRERGEAS